jgi:Predicted transcriptional regulators
MDGIKREVRGVWLKNNRASKGISQEELAKLTGISVAHIRKIEQGSRIGSKEVWDKIIKCLEAPTFSKSLDKICNDISKYGTNCGCTVFFMVKKDGIHLTKYDLELMPEPFVNEHFFISTLGNTLELFNLQRKGENVEKIRLIS